MGYKIEDIDDDNNNDEYGYLDETLHFLDEVDDEDVRQDVIDQAIEEHNKEELDKFITKNRAEIEELNHEIGALEYEIILRKKEKHQLVMKKAQMILDKEVYKNGK